MSSPKNERNWIGFDLGGTNMTAAVFSEKMKIRGSCRKKTKAYKGLEPTLDRMGKVIEKAAEDAGLPLEDIDGIGVGTPGSLNLSDGVILNAPNLGWDDVPLRDVIRKKTDCPVVLMNDVDAGIYGEYASGAGQKGRCVVGIFPGTGVGGGCVMNGRLLTAGKSS